MPHPLKEKERQCFENLYKTDVETFKASSIEYMMNMTVHEAAERDNTGNDNDDSDYIISQIVAIARKDRLQIRQLVYVFWFEQA